MVIFSDAQLLKCSNAQMLKCLNTYILSCSDDQMLKCSHVQMLKCSNARMLKCSYSQVLKCSPKDKSHVVRSTPTARQAAGGKSHWLFILKFSLSPLSSWSSLSKSSWSSWPSLTCRGLPWWRWTWGSSCALAGTPSAEVRGRSSWNRSYENIFATEEGVVRRYNRINICSMLTTLLVYAKER